MEDHEEEYKKSIRHHELASVTYFNKMEEKAMPLGLKEHDVYLINWIYILLIIESFNIF